MAPVKPASSFGTRLSRSSSLAHPVGLRSRHLGEPIDYAPQAPPVNLSAPQPARASVFMSAPPGWDGDWHPTPRRQIVFYLAGEVEVEASDGEARRFGPGGVTLGDNVYEDGSARQFADCYGPTWGRHKDRTRPAPGNHDYGTCLLYTSPSPRDS